MKSTLEVKILCDIPDSFFLKKANRLIQFLRKQGINAEFYNDFDLIKEGGILFLISSQKILSEKEINRFEKCFVVHPSKLPHGKGSAALANYILNGQNEIWVTIFEPTVKIDSGDIWCQDRAKLKGHELLSELREIQFKLIKRLVSELLLSYPMVKKTPQPSNSTYFKKRTPNDSEISVEQSIKQQFNLLRIVDNVRYPAFFYMNGKKYILKIYQAPIKKNT
jgi:methionyl-tRNA formyltransferase